MDINKFIKDHALRTVVALAFIDGQPEPVEYDLCRYENESADPPEGFKYIGSGWIHSIDGYRQSSERRYKFFRKI